jgi:ribulose-phosphate 3-epimerase
MMKEKKIVPSILAANFAHLEDDVQKALGAGASILHLDIMDGNFVPNISFGPDIVRRVNEFTHVPLDTHLMIEKPDRYLEAFKKAGSDILTVHVEACRHLHRTVTKIKELGMKAGVCVNPATPLSNLDDILPFADLILIMSVNPGFGGQKFIEASIRKVRNLKRMIEERNLDTIIEIDGGIDSVTINKVKNEGVHYFVTGNAVFGDGNIDHNYKTLNQLIS